MSPRIAHVILIVSIASAALNVFAEEAEEVVAARLHDRRAQELFDSGDFEGALREMEAAQSLLPSTSRLYNMAACNEELGNRQQAIELYRQFIASPDAPEGRRQRAERQLQQLEESGAETSSAGATGDGGASPSEGGTDPEAAGSEGAGPSTSGDQGEDVGTSAPSTASGRRRISPAIFYSLLGLTAASAIAMAALGGVAMEVGSDYERNITEDCQRASENRDTGENLVIATNVMMGVSIAFAIPTLIVGVLTLLRNRSVSSARVTITPSATAGGASLSLSGRF